MKETKQNLPRSWRATAEDDQVLKWLSRSLGVNGSSAIRVALREAARSRGWKSEVSS